ncbi:MAG: hypothetical protein JSW27_12285 [Phycisphaerales bacterium]|nr:MAG: hypothetical protein JSW27_12285 [Phycisphaerales bacterium]
MSHFRTYLAYAWALMAGPLVLATFMGMSFWAEKLVAVTGLRVHPIYSGGEVAQTIEHGEYKTLIHHPVFDGLIGERNEGFVQIEWHPLGESLPDHIEEHIDFDQDGRSDFRIALTTGTNEAEFEPSNQSVLSLDTILTIQSGRLFRVSLLNDKS